MYDLIEIYRHKSPSTLAKSVLTLFHLSMVFTVAWLLFSGGSRIISQWLNIKYESGSQTRSILLFGAEVVYFLRLLLTYHIFIKRRMNWFEVSMIAVWIGVVELSFAFLGSRQNSSVGLVEIVGVLLYLCGSWLNSGSEYQRFLWKKQPQHYGRLYTSGLFRYSMHINYFGDLVLFTGWAFLTARLVSLIIPVLTFFNFVYLNIPALDRYLMERYGEAFREYASRTKKIIPFIY